MSVVRPHWCEPISSAIALLFFAVMASAAPAWQPTKTVEFSMNKGSPWKTLAAMLLGFTLAATGLDNVTGQLRLTFGFAPLMKGFDFLIAVIGLFGIGHHARWRHAGLVHGLRHCQALFPQGQKLW